MIERIIHPLWIECPSSSCWQSDRSYLTIGIKWDFHRTPLNVEITILRINSTTRRETCFASRNPLSLSGCSAQPKKGPVTQHIRCLTQWHTSKTPGHSQFQMNNHQIADRDQVKRLSTSRHLTQLSICQRVSHTHIKHDRGSTLTQPPCDPICHALAPEGWEVPIVSLRPLNYSELSVELRHWGQRKLTIQHRKGPREKGDFTHICPLFELSQSKFTRSPRQKRNLITTIQLAFHHYNHPRFCQRLLWGEARRLELGCERLCIHLQSN